MPDLAGRGPMGQKAGKAKPDPKYLSRVRELPCVICEGFNLPQTTPTAAHHVIHGRHSQRKVADDMAISLCWNHHQGPEGIHTNPARWKRLYGLDTDYIAETRAKLGV